MKILWVTPQFPCKQSGGQVRQFYLLKHLCQDNSVKVISLIRQNELNEVSALRDLGAEVVTEVFHPYQISGKWENRFQSWKQTLFDPYPHYARTYPIDMLRVHITKAINTWHPDVIQFEHLYVAQLAKLTGDMPRILTEQNVESLIARRQIKFTHSTSRQISAWIEAQKLRAWEVKMLRQYKTCIAVSPDDAREIHQLAPGVTVLIIPNGVDVPYFSQRSETNPQREGILFFGNLGYPPNADALDYFIRDIFPPVHDQFPDKTLTIVGPNASSETRDLGRIPGVHFLGFVEDLRPFLWRAEASIVPLRSGGGTRLKILESLAADCPVVSTDIGAEGLELVGGRDLMLANNPDDFAECLISLLASPDLQKKLSRQGKATVTEKYDWGNISPKLEEIYKSTVDQFQRIS